MSLRALLTAATGMNAQSQNVDVVANNVANVNTTGFKAFRANFEDLLYQQLRPAGTQAATGTQVPTGTQIGLGTRLVSTQRIFTEGSFLTTDNDFDVAIRGNGFFQILQSDGSLAYTRAGAFTLNSEGTIVDPNGNPVEGEIQIPEDAVGVSIGLNGTVQVLIDGETEPETVGQIDLAIFVNPAGLLSVGDNLLLETAASGSPIVGTPGEEGLGQVVQGVLEASNVDVVTELVNMVEAQRAFEFNSQVLNTANEMLQRLTQLR